MEEKIRKSHPTRAFLLLFISLSLFFACIFAPVLAISRSHITFDDIQYIFDILLEGKNQKTILMNETLAPYLSSLIKSTRENQPYFSLGEQDNLAFFASQNGKILTNTLPENEEQLRDYSYLIIINQGQLGIFYHPEALSEYLPAHSMEDISYAALNSDKIHRYSSIMSSYYDFMESPSSANSEIVLAVKDELVQNYRSGQFSHLYELIQQINIIRIAARSFCALVLSVFVLLILSIASFRDRREFNARLAKAFRHLWFELRLIILVLDIALFTACLLELLSIWSYVDILSIILLFSLLIALFWVFYFCVVDIKHNGKQYFTHNTINSLRKAVINHIGSKNLSLPFQKRMRNRFLLLIISESILIIICFICVFGMPFLSILSAVAGIWILFFYFTRWYSPLMQDIGLLSKQIESIRNGDDAPPLQLSSSSGLAEMAEELNEIQSGINMAVDRRIRSERMKIDLITNVSHDLKTPLTSIIGYIDLLEKEELSPQCRDYVTVLAKKAERLRVMIQDIFEVSKATSGNLELHIEPIDLCRLTEQTLADMKEKTDASELSFRVNLSPEPVYVMSDGERMYRVFQNLIDNALRYSLSGSRVYIHVWQEADHAICEFKNTASYEMNFGNLDITDRFVRGDASRTAEGSGLGLSIARSFTEACGGSLSVITDGDLFKVTIRFPLCSNPANISADSSNLSKTFPDLPPMPAVRENDIIEVTAEEAPPF